MSSEPPKHRFPWRADSLIGELVRWAGAAFLLGLVAVAVTAWLAEQRAARNLTDFAMIDFLRKEVRAPIIECGPSNHICLDAAYRNETGGIWRFHDTAGVAHHSYSFDLSGFGVFGAGVDACDRARERRVDEFELFDCAFPSATLQYRVARQAGAKSIIALELPIWRDKVDRALGYFVVSRSLQNALLAMTATLALTLALALILLRRRLQGHFSRLSAEIDAFRAGEQSGVRGHYPAEVRELISSLNRAIDKSDGLITRQRRNVAKMAHDLRHQLVNLDVAARDGDMEGVAAESRAVRNLAERYLTLVDWVGPVEGQKPTPIAPALEAARKAFSRRLRETPIKIDWRCDDDLTLRVHPTDLNIILTNLMTNAHRHARSRVLLSAARTNDATLLRVDDDGPGIPADQRERLQQWGARLDEAGPGDGFGLAIIVEQIRELYRGETRPEESPLGGLRVELAFPAT